jgi:hypothetical protein
MSEPAHSGIDTKASLVFYLRRLGRGGYACIYRFSKRSRGI